MPVDYAAYKTVLNDVQYATKINDFIDAVETNMNEKLDTSAVTFKEIAAITADYTVLDTDYTLEVDATVASITVTLPNVATNEGRILVFVRKDNTAYAVNLGAITTLDLLNECITLQSNGTTWKRIA